VNIASPTAVADAVLMLIDDNALRLRIGEAARKTVTSYFTVERQMDQYAEFYKELIAQTCQ
jgi:glycosyltransferase involved in cell wall biosynthesis